MDQFTQTEEPVAPAKKRISRSSRIRQQALESVNEETVNSLEQVFEAKMAAIRTYEQKMATVTDPYARRSLQYMIQEERNQLLNLADLVEIVEQSPDMGRLGRARKRLTHQMRTTPGRNVTLGLGIAILGVLMLPTVRDTLRPIALRAFQGVMDLSEQAQGLVAGMKEDLEDIVAEAQFEKLKDSMNMVEETMPDVPDSKK
jgi:hypothetical protein